MRTLVLVGNSLTRVFQQAGETRVYTPRDYPFPESGAGA
jgi:precorrin-3B methylase